MTKKREGGAFLSAVFDGFPCLDTARRLGGTHSAERMVNFRPDADGSLRKRCGYESILAMPKAPRAVYAGYFSGEEVFYFLSGSTVFRQSDDDEYGYVYAGKVATLTGDAAFSEFAGRLWLLDGDDIYVLTDGVFTPPEGYIPLYARNWDPLLRGEVYEAENLLTPRVRFHFKNTEKRDTVYFGRRVVSIHRVFLDGVEVAKTDVELLATGGACMAESFIAASEIELVVTLDVKDRRGEVSSCRRAIAYGGARDNRLITWDGTDGSAFCVSSPVSLSDAALSDEWGGGGGGALYFPIGAEDYRVDAPLTAVCRYFDRLLLFTASGAWAADCSESTELLVTPVHSTVGCDKKDCAALCGNSPVTYFGGKLWKWTARTSTQRECSAEVLSAPVAALTAEMREGTVLMCYYGDLSELWIARANDADGRVLIYNTVTEGFYTFEGVPADRFVRSGGAPMLLLREELYAFRDTLKKDCGEREIAAFYRSAWIDFGHPERTKHLLGFSFTGDPDDGRITVRLEGERGHCAAFDLFGKSGETPNLYDRRAAVGRFRYLRVSLEADGTSSPTLVGITLTARK